MLSEEIRTRLAQLHAPQRFALPVPAVASAEAMQIADGHELENSAGKHLRFVRPLQEFCPGVQEAAARSHAADRGERAANVHAELAAVAEHFPHSTLFLDLETCGFAGSPVFLVGLVRQTPAGLSLEQLFARNYAEERAVLATLWQTVDANRVLVTFNGKSFDWPMIRDRSTRHHLAARSQLVHCDLLHHARRRFKDVLPNCRLQTLERYVCRRFRRDDLPGAQVPLAYHDYVRTSAPERIAPILQHNALDLVTLVQLAMRLAAS